MKEFFHSVKFKILICIAALLLGLMTYVAVAAGTQTLPEQVINTITYPFVTAANAISNGVNGFIDRIYKKLSEDGKIIKRGVGLLGN